MPGPIAQAVADWIAARQRGERPIRDAIVNAFQGQPQTQAPAPAPVQRQAPQGPVAAPQPSPLAPYAPMQRPTASAQAPAPFVPMQRPERPNPLASFVPMARPEQPVPLPPPNPERTAPMGVPGPSNPAVLDWRIDVPQMAQPQAPGMLQFNEGMMADQGNFMPGVADAAPVIPVERGGPPGWRSAAGTPDVYGPGMAVPRGTPGRFADLPVPQPGFDALLRDRYGPSMLSMETAQSNYNALPTPQRRNIERMNMAQLQQFVSSGDPNAAELRRVRARLAQLEVEAIMFGQGVGNAPGGVPAGPGV